jgi:hypothetical protein
MHVVTNSILSEPSSPSLHCFSCAPYVVYAPRATHDMCDTLGAGGALGLARYCQRFASTPRRAQVMCWTLGVAIFYDDYSCVLITGVSLAPRTVTQLLCFRYHKKCTEVPHAAKCGRHFHRNFQYKMYQIVPPTFCRAGYFGSGYAGGCLFNGSVTRSSLRHNLRIGSLNAYMSKVGRCVDSRVTVQETL